MFQLILLKLSVLLPFQFQRTLLMSEVSWVSCYLLQKVCQRLLYKLLGQSTKFEFTEERKTALEKLTQALVTAPILRYPDFDKEFFLYCDSSDYSIGYILGQKDNDSREVVIHCGGCALMPAEINYPITHKEGLALVEGIKYYHIYLI